MTRANKFENHKITLELKNELFKSWMCANPASSEHWFRIVTWPGHLFVGGGIEAFVFVDIDPYMIEWSMRPLDPEYIASKCICGVPKKFDADARMSWINNEIAKLDNDGYTKDAEHLRDIIENEYDIASFFYGELPDHVEFTVGFKTCLEALAWFISNNH